MSIPKGLIIYRSPKYHQNIPIQTKYAIHSNRLDFPSSQEQKSINRKLPMFFNSNKRFINQVKFPNTLNNYNNKHFLDFVLRLKSLQTLDLQILSSSYYHEPIVLSNLKRLIHYLFSKIRRLKSLTINCAIVIPERYKHFWKSLFKLSTLTKLNLHFVYQDHDLFEKDLAFYEGKNKQRYWRKLQSHDMDITLKYNTSHQRSNPFQAPQNMTPIRDVKPPFALHVNLDLPSYSFDVSVMENWLFSLQDPMANLVELRTKPFPEDQFSPIIQLLQGNKSLKSLEIYIGRLLSGSDFLGLAHALPTISSVKSLEVHFQDLEASISPCFLIKQIGKISTLSSLKIIFASHFIPSPFVFEALSDCLLEMKKLQEFTLDFTAGDKNPEYQRFGSILLNISEMLPACMPNLHSLSLSFKGKNFSLTDKTLRALEVSLPKLIHLKELNLNITSDEISAEGIKALGNGLGNMRGLENLNLDIYSCGQLSEEVICDVLGNLSKNKNLMIVKLRFLCLRLGKLFSDALEKLTDELKFLVCLGLQMKDSNIQGIYLLDLMRKLKKRIIVEM